MDRRCYFCDQKATEETLAIISFEQNKDREELILENILTFCWYHLCLREHIEEWVDQWRAETIDYEDFMDNLACLREQAIEKG